MPLLQPRVVCGVVFLSYLVAGLSTTAIHKRLMIYRVQAAVNITAHRLRHTFASDLVSVDVPVTTIQKLLGHAWLETTQTYVAANDHQVQADYYAASQKLEGWSCKCLSRVRCRTLRSCAASGAQKSSAGELSRAASQR